MPTRKIIFWFVAAGILYMIALNIGSGWLYVVTSLLAATPLAGFILGRLNAGRLTVKQAAGEKAIQGESLSSHIEVSNRSLLPRFFLRLDCSLGGSDTSHMIPFLGPRRMQTAKVEFAALRRGVYPGGRVSISSGAPAGLTRNRRSVDTCCPLVVYPGWQRLEGDWTTGHKNSGYMVASTLPTRSTSSDYLGVRDYRPEDSPRSIHWRTSARFSKLAVIEFARQAAIGPVFILDLFREGEAGFGDKSTFETAVTVTASLVQREIQNNRRFGLGACPDDAADRGLSHEGDPAMLWLAWAQPTAMRPLDLSRSALPWPEVTPILILTSHRAYALMHESEFIASFPQSIIIMLDGRGFTGDPREMKNFLDDDGLDRLADGLENVGCMYMSADSPEEALQCLASL